MAQATDLDIADLRARVWRSLDETEKFIAEQRRARDESAKLDRERPFNPAWAVVGGAVAAASLIGAGTAIAKAFFPCA